jgi:hypothetical protein
MKMGRFSEEQISCERTGKDQSAPKILEIRLVGLVLLWIPANTRLK